MSSEYDLVNKGKLRLKDDKLNSNKIKKKKKNKKESKKIAEALCKLGDNKLVEEVAKLAEKDEQIREKIADKEVVKEEPTKAELAFRQMQEKRLMERILKKASKSHKQRVEEFNSHLDSLSEHYDIPKVSWTK